MLEVPRDRFVRLAHQVGEHVEVDLREVLEVEAVRPVVCGPSRWSGSAVRVDPWPGRRSWRPCGAEPRRRGVALAAAVVRVVVLAEPDDRRAPHARLLTRDAREQLEQRLGVAAPDWVPDLVDELVHRGIRQWPCRQPTRPTYRERFGSALSTGTARHRAHGFAAALLTGQRPRAAAVDELGRVEQPRHERDRDAVDQHELVWRCAGRGGCAGATPTSGRRCTAAGRPSRPTSRALARYFLMNWATRAREGAVRRLDDHAAARGSRASAHCRCRRFGLLVVTATWMASVLSCVAASA